MNSAHQLRQKHISHLLKNRRCQWFIQLAILGCLLFTTQITSAVEPDVLSNWKNLVRNGQSFEANKLARQYLSQQGNDIAVIQFLASIESDPVELQKLNAKAVDMAEPQAKPEILKQLAYTAFLEERYTDVITYFQKLVSLGHDSRELVFYLGCAYKRLGDDSQATMNFYQLITAGTRDYLFDAAAFNIGEMNENRGNKLEAMKYYKLINKNDTPISKLATERLLDLSSSDIEEPYVEDEEIEEETASTFPPSEKAQAEQKTEETKPVSAHPTAKPESRPDTGDYTYLVQVGAFSVRKNVEILQAQLAELGYSTVVSINEQDKRTVYRVRIGPFKERKQADAVVESLKSKKNIFSYVIKYREGE